MLTNTEQDARAVGAWPLDEDKPAHTGLGHPAPPLQAGTAARRTLNDMGAPGPGAEASLQDAVPHTLNDALITACTTTPRSSANVCSGARRQRLYLTHVSTEKLHGARTKSMCPPTLYKFDPENIIFPSVGLFQNCKDLYIIFITYNKQFLDQSKNFHIKIFFKKRKMRHF